MKPTIQTLQREVYKLIAGIAMTLTLALLSAPFVPVSDRLTNDITVKWTMFTLFVMVTIFFIIAMIGHIKYIRKEKKMELMYNDLLERWG